MRVHADMFAVEHLYLRPCGEVKARGTMAADINDSHSQNISLRRGGVGGGTYDK
jgi:hypothetical protein